MISVDRLAPRLARWWAIALFFLLGASMGARAVPIEVAVGGAERQINLGMNSQLLEDATGSLTLADVIQRDRDWSAYHGDSYNLGFSRSTWWVRMRVHYRGDLPARRILEVASALQDEIDFYVVRSDGTVLQSVQTGDRRPFENRPIHSRVPTFHVDFAPNQTLDIYVRLGSHDGLQEATMFKLWQPDAHVQSVQSETLAFGLYYGTLITVLLYHLFLFISTRQRSFAWYCGYVSAFLFWSFAFRGYAFQYLWPDSPDFNNQILPMAAAACYAMFGAFMVSYLQTARRAPRFMHRAILASIAGSVICVTPALWDRYALSFALSIPFGVVQIVLALIIGSWLAVGGYRPARYFIMAFFMLAVGVVLYYTRVLGVVPSNILTENFLQIGSALEVLLLAFGLADRMNTLRAEKLAAERQALAAQEALTTELENLVQRRTRALESANQRLAAMAITDELTGAYNRRHFNTALQAEVARHKRHHCPLVLCMTDIDEFKRYNDRYGHLAGDRVLQQVAQTVKQNLQRAGDQFFRLGGEEFALILNVNEPWGRTQEFVERIRADIEALGIEHDKSAQGVITCSFGLLWVLPDSTLARAEDIYASAAALLYQAKAAGRNCVISQMA